MGLCVRPSWHTAAIVVSASLVSSTLPHCGQVAWLARQGAPRGMWGGQEQREAGLGASSGHRESSWASRAHPLLPCSSCMCAPVPSSGLS